MWGSSKKAVLCVMILMVFSEAVAKPPSAIKQSDYIGPDDYSFVARITFSGPGEPSSCAGAIISPRHILTAGSCLHDKIVAKVYTGIQHGPNESAVESDVQQLLLHNFTMKSESQDVQNDIAIVMLNKDLVFSLRQQNIPLPASQPAENVVAWFAGWEPTSDVGDVQLTFKKTQITLRSGQQCLTSGTDDEKAQKLCGQQPNANLCPGESGSPVVRDGVLFGIASVDPCSGGSVRYYTNVFHHLNWIENVIYNQL